MAKIKNDAVDAMIDAHADTPTPETVAEVVAPESVAAPSCPQRRAECTGKRTYRGIHNGGHWYECEACGNGNVGDAPV